MIDPVDYDLARYEKRQSEISMYCDEYQERVFTLLDKIKDGLKALREEYEPIIGFGNCDEIDAVAWDNRF